MVTEKFCQLTLNARVFQLGCLRSRDRGRGSCIKSTGCTNTIRALKSADFLRNLADFQGLILMMPPVEPDYKKREEYISSVYL